jgi:predicted AAA+ superfamily ATPase
MLFKGKVIIITGPRQAGKTTLLKKLASEIQPRPLFLNCDETDARQMLTDTTSSQLRQIAGNNKVVIIDEGQRVKNIGLTLKLFTDELPEIQLVVSGSSALELANQINGPLTGRKFENNLFPLSRRELVSHHTLIEGNRWLEDRLIFGSYPEIIIQVVYSNSYTVMRYINLFENVYIGLVKILIRFLIRLISAIFTATMESMRMIFYPTHL